MAEHLQRLDAAVARRIGEAAQRRVRADHTYDHRALQLETLLEGREAPAALKAAA